MCAGLDDIINRFTKLSLRNCAKAHEERKHLIDRAITDLFSWAEHMTTVSHFTFRSTTPANVNILPNQSLAGFKTCWNKECPHMNQLIKMVNDKIHEVYKRNPSTRVNYLDGWKLLGGYCPSEACTSHGQMPCFTSRSAEFDDYYHSAYLAYELLAPWLENICRNDSGN